MLGLFKGACFGLIGFLFLLVRTGALWGVEPYSLHKQSVEFPLDFNVSLNLRNFSSKQLKYRYHSFGNTRLQIVALNESLSIPESQSSTVVVSLLTGDKEKNILQLGSSLDLDQQISVYDISLKDSGTYLLSPPQNHRVWKVKCLSGCGREEISLAKFLASLSQKEVAILARKLTQLVKLDKKSIGEGNPERSVEFLKAVATKNDAWLSRFPSLPSTKELNLLRPYLGKALSREKFSYTQETPPFNWEEVVDKFVFKSHPKLSPADPELPEIRYGHFISKSVPLKIIAQNYALAWVMTALAEQKGYELSFPTPELDRVVIKTLDQFLETLWATGHHIELRDERSLANFLSFSKGEKYIRWPVWFNTQVKLKDNSQLYLPAPHSQFVWQITGPIINGRVNFFLGIKGVGFFPKFDEERPQWTGFESRTQIVDESDLERNIIRRATRHAETYLRRIRLESLKYAPDYPSDGYGFTGICNDSSAVIERAFKRETTFFPIFRAPQLFTMPRLEDGLDEVISLLPRDSVNSGIWVRGSQEELNYRQRVGAMVSFPYDSNFVWDKKFFKEAKELLNP